MRAYCDESGTHNGAEDLSVGGYLFTPANAQIFQTNWSERLRQNNLPYFHAADCASADGIFSALRDADRMALFGDLVALVKQTATIGFIAALNRDEYKQWVASKYNRTLRRYLAGCGKRESAT